MKGGRKKTQRGAGGASTSRAWTSLEIVLLDQEPLRKKAALDCSREMARLEKLRSQWTRFEREDRPQFERWMAHNFGALLTELREGDRIIHERRSLIEEVHEAVYFGEARTLKAAYKFVLERRNAPDVDEPPPFAGSDGTDPFFDFRDQAADEEEVEMLFEEFLDAHFGVFVESLSKKDYARLFAKFKQEVLGQAPQDSEKEPPRATKPSVTEKPETARIKELYRQLVRRLHPDVRTDASPAATALWHEVQDAYSAGNLERLETLFALSELTDATISSGTSLHQLRSAFKELKRSVQSVLRSLSSAKKDPAWNFGATTEHSALRTRIEREMKRDRAAQLEVLAEMDALIASWEKPNRKRKAPKAKSKE